MLGVIVLSNNRISILAEDLGVSDGDIYFNNDEYMCNNKIYKIMSDDELIDYLEKCIVSQMNFPFNDYNIGEVCSILEISEDELNGFFVADVLLGNIRAVDVGEDMIYSNALCRYLNFTNKLDEFSKKYAEKSFLNDDYFNIFTYRERKKIKGMNIFYLEELMTAQSNILTEYDLFTEGD